MSRTKYRLRVGDDTAGFVEDVFARIDLIAKIFGDRIRDMGEPVARGVLLPDHYQPAGICCGGGSRAFHYGDNGRLPVGEVGHEQSCKQPSIGMIMR
jgi:hypothetical protein